MPLFSVIIPTFNSQATIKECIDSILQQNFNDFEVIIQDGISKDNTLQFIREYNDDRIKIFAEEDNGVYDAMNKAISKTSGEWLFFLGSDDILYNENILTEVSRFMRSDESLNFVYGSVYFKKAQVVYDGEFDRLKLTTIGNISHQAIFYRKKLFQTLGYYNLEFKIWADWDFNIRCFSWPNLKSKYIDLTISLYNDTDGLSAQAMYDEAFLKLLPLEQKKYTVIDEFQKQSLDFKFGKKILDIPRWVRNLFRSN